MQVNQQDISDHSGSDLEFAQWLQELRLLDANPRCEGCGSAAIIQPSRDYQADGVCFRCRNWRCHRAWSVRAGSFFPANAHLSILQQCRLIVAWHNRVTAASTARQWGITRLTVQDYFNQYLSQIVRYVDTLIDNGEFNFMGGENVVEIDESVYQNVRDEATGHLHETRWVIGLMERTTGLLWLEQVPNRRRVSLLPIIEEHVPAGTIVNTDEFSTYAASLSDRGYLHFSINHSAGEYVREDEYFDGANMVPTTVTTNHLESVWATLRGAMRYRAQRTVQNIDRELSRLMFDSKGMTIWDLMLS